MVRIVRVLWRLKLERTQARGTSCGHLGGELSVDHVQPARGALGGVRIVGDHDDGLAVLAVERLQQVEDAVAGLAIEIAGRLVGEDERRDR